MIAKIASDKNKPNGVCIVNQNSEDEMNFMMDLKIRKIPGVGEKSEIKYNLLGYLKTKDFLFKPAELYYLLPSHHFDFIIKSSLGIGKYCHSDDKPELQKSISIQNWDVSFCCQPPTSLHSRTKEKGKQ